MAFPSSLRSRLLWCRPLPGGAFVLAFPQASFSGVAALLRAGGCSGFAVLPCPSWRSFPAAVCVRFVPPAAWVSALGRLPSGAGGSQHPIGSGLVRF
jgi:hypothetical protein